MTSEQTTLEDEKLECEVCGHYGRDVQARHYGPTYVIACDDCAEGNNDD